MRDPQRIDRILAKVAKAWHKHPDLRLNQLIYNLMRANGGDGSGDYNAEDEELEAYLDAFLARKCPP